jgi:hypothetical protein
MSTVPGLTSWSSGWHRGGSARPVGRRAGHDALRALPPSAPHHGPRRRLSFAGDRSGEQRPPRPVGRPELRSTSWSGAVDPNDRRAGGPPAADSPDAAVGSLSSAAWRERPTNVVAAVARSSLCPCVRALRERLRVCDPNGRQWGAQRVRAGQPPFHRSWSPAACRSSSLPCREGVGRARPASHERPRHSSATTTAVDSAYNHARAAAAVGRDGSGRVAL